MSGEESSSPGGAFLPNKDTLEACYGIVCDICCYQGYCVDDELVCTVDPKADYGVIAILLIVVACLLIGIPLILLILDLLMLRKPFGSNSMSFCEFWANYICCLCCLNRKYRKIANKDEVDSFAIPSQPRQGGKKSKSANREKAVAAADNAGQNS